MTPLRATRSHRPFLLTGSGRCGTGYTAQLLQQLGYACGHEDVFGIEAALGGPWREAFEAAGCDSSWLAAPLIPDLPEETLVLHQVRNPVRVVRSLQGIEFLTANARATSPYSRYASVTLDLPADELEASMRFWASWNELIEFAAASSGHLHGQFRLEELDAALVRDLVSLIEPDRELGDDELAAAFEAVPTSYNARPRDEAVTWESLPEGELKEAIEQRAERYGYTLLELTEA